MNTAFIFIGIVYLVSCAWLMAYWIRGLQRTATAIKLVRVPLKAVLIDILDAARHDCSGRRTDSAGTADRIDSMQRRVEALEALNPKDLGIMLNSLDNLIRDYGGTNVFDLNRKALEISATHLLRLQCHIQDAVILSTLSGLDDSYLRQLKDNAATILSPDVLQRYFASGNAAKHDINDLSIRLVQNLLEVLAKYAAQPRFHSFSARRAFA